MLWRLIARRRAGHCRHGAGATVSKVAVIKLHRGPPCSDSADRVLLRACCWALAGVRLHVRPAGRLTCRLRAG